MLMCIRHPGAARHRGHCAACLLEEALAPTPPLAQPDGTITIHVPLGRTVSSSVFLVRGDGPVVRLLRLKTWHAAAPEDFTERFERLQRQLSEWHHEAIPVPLAASVDAAGRPSVLSEFHQGVPIVDRVEAGGLAPAEAEACLTRLLAATHDGHERGLVHGSIVSGNIIVAARCTLAYLLDFGHAALVAPEGADAPTASDDYAGFDRLIRAVRTPASAGPHPSVTSCGFS